MNLKGRHFLSLMDYTEEEIYYLVSKGIEFKKLRRIHKLKRFLQGKTIVLIFEKPSTRTRVSFETGVYQLGGNSIYLSPRDIQLSRGESVKDTARVISRYADGVVIRTFSQDYLEEFAKYSNIPVINGLTDEFHPCQILADFMTILEEKKRLKGVKLSFVGDGNNVANSLIIGGIKLGMEITVATPPGFEPSKDILKIADDYSGKNKGKLEILNDPKKACTDADVIYTDVWISMGQEEEGEEKVSLFKEFQVNKELVSLAKKEVMVMHCLPAHRNFEITDEIMEKYENNIFEQSENRLHAQKSLLFSLVG